VRTTEELLEGKVAAPVLKIDVNDHGNPLRWPRDTLYPQKLALTSPTSGGRSVSIVRLRTKATEFSLVFRVTVISSAFSSYCVLKEERASFGINVAGGWNWKFAYI
jgi:hypothetical protein